jgi:hypothetical protein
MRTIATPMYPTDKLRGEQAVEALFFGPDVRDSRIDHLAWSVYGLYCNSGMAEIAFLTGPFTTLGLGTPLI